VIGATDGPPVARGAPSARALLRRQFRLAHELLDAAIERATPEAIHRRPPGTAAPAGARYAQVVLGQDLSINGVLAAGTPLALSTWAGRTGLSELPPLGGPTERRAWAGRVRLDLAALRPYVRAVHASTDAYLAALPDEALDPARGELPSCLLSALLLTVAMRRGEIACLLALERRSTAPETTG
jgi:DinB superfamily